MIIPADNIFMIKDLVENNGYILVSKTEIGNALYFTLNNPNHTYEFCTYDNTIKNYIFELK